MAIDTVVSTAERAVTEGIAGARYTTLNGSICTGDVCPGMTGGVVRFYDTNHLTVRFSASLAPELSRALTFALRSP